MIKINEKVLHTNGKVTPFLKWAGGKRWLAQSYVNLFPDTYNIYIEPFLGSGSVFFNLQPQDAILSDLNYELIETFKALKQNWKIVYKYLQEHGGRHSKEYYYQIRKIEYRSTYKQAAKFIYLNRTCWNGLYRVNLQRKFNVPIGTKTNVVLPTDDFQKVSELLSNVIIVSEDFEVIIDKAQKGDFVFADPPYTVKHNNNGFLKYNEKLFSWDDQIRLRDCLLRARKRGVHIVATNADHDSIRDLYEGNFEIKQVSRASIIAANSKYRRKCDELIIKNV